jgi:hypothetical protein
MCFSDNAVDLQNRDQKENDQRKGRHRKYEINDEKANHRLQIPPVGQCGNPEFVLPIRIVPDVVALDGTPNLKLDACPGGAPLLPAGHGP